MMFKVTGGFPAVYLHRIMYTYVYEPVNVCSVNCLIIQPHLSYVVGISKSFKILCTMCLHACPSYGKFKYLRHVIRHVRIAE